MSTKRSPRAGNMTTKHDQVAEDRKNSIGDGGSYSNAPGAHVRATRVHNWFRLRPMLDAASTRSIPRGDHTSCFISSQFSKRKKIRCRDLMPDSRTAPADSL